MDKRLSILFRYGGPPFLVLAIDVICILWLNRTGFLLPARFAILVSLLTMVAGWIPLLLQPSTESRQAALVATLLAAVLLIPPPTQSMNQAFLLPLEDFSTLQYWRIFNSLCMLPCILHLVALFARNKVFLKRAVLIPFYLSSLFWIACMILLENSQGLYWLRQIILLWIVAALILLLVILIQGVRNIQNREAREVQQLRGILFVGILVIIPVFLRFGGLFFNVELISYELFLAGLVALPLGVGYIILRHNLFGIDELIRRAVGYTVISIMASLVLFLIATATGNRAANRVPEFRWGSIFIALLVLSIFFTPLQHWLQKKIDHWFYPERYHFHMAMQEIQECIMRVIKKAELTKVLEEEVPLRIGANWAKWVPGILPKTPQVALENSNWGTLLKVEHKVLGGYWLGERRSGLPFSSEEQQQLEMLCQQTALAIAYAQALEMLEEINIGLEKRVAERSAKVLEQKQALMILTERRRIARDLHDSISQTLFSINLGARAIRKLAERKPQTAMEELIHLEISAQTAQLEMRSLLNELREPPQAVHAAGTIELVSVLKDHFRQLAEQPGMDGHPPLLEVTYEGPASLWLTANLAEVVLLICREALHNVIKHAGVREAAVKMWRTPDSLIIQIVDQGHGFINKIKLGSMGLENMRTRLSIFGGELIIENQTLQGCSIKASLPWTERE